MIWEMTYILVFRSMQRLKHSMPGVSLVLDTIVKTVPEISYMMLLWFCVSVLFITFGCSFFADVPHLQSSLGYHQRRGQKEILIFDLDP